VHQTPFAGSTEKCPSLRQARSTFQGGQRRGGRNRQASDMRSLRSISIRQKLLLVSLATTATALLLASAAFIVLGVSLARQSEIQRAEALLGISAANLCPPCMRRTSRKSNSSQKSSSAGRKS
jgi:hypothetical protein